MLAPKCSNAQNTSYCDRIIFFWYPSPPLFLKPLNEASSLDVSVNCAVIAVLRYFKALSYQWNSLIASFIECPSPQWPALGRHTALWMLGYSAELQSKNLQSTLQWIRWINFLKLICQQVYLALEQVANNPEAWPVICFGGNINIKRQTLFTEHRRPRLTSEAHFGCCIWLQSLKKHAHPHHGML